MPYNYKIIQDRPLEEMNLLFNQAKIVFNISRDCELNMRVFEALGSGSLLLTDRVSGLTDLFEPGYHFGIYDSNWYF